MRLNPSWVWGVLVVLLFGCADTHPRAPVIDLVSNTPGGPAPLMPTFDTQPAETYAAETVYTWKINGTAVAGEEATLTHTFVTPGNYEVAVRATNPVGRASDSTTVLVTDNAPADACNVTQTNCIRALDVVPFETERPQEEPGAAEGFAGLQVSAATQWLDFSEEAYGSALRAVVTLQNPTDRAVTLDTSGCRLRLHIFDDPERAGGPLEESGMECDLGRELIVPPRGERVIDKHATLSDLPDERYYFDVRLMLNAGTLELAAGSADIDYTLPFSYEAVTNVASRNGQPDLQSAITLTNQSDEAITITFGACILNVQLYLTEARIGKPVYDYLAQPDFGCPGYLAGATVEPGASLLADEFKNFIAIAELADAVGVAGVYHLRLRLDLNEQEMIFDPGVLVLGAR